MGLNLSLVNTDEKPRQLSEESIQKIRIANTGKPNKYKGLKRSKEECENIRKGSIGKKLSEEHKQKISDRNSGVLSHLFGKFGEEHHCWGRKHSEETKEKIKAASTGANSSQAKKVIDTDTGFIYNTVVEASLAFGISSLSMSRRLRGVVKNDTPLKFLIVTNK